MGKGGAGEIDSFLQLAGGILVGGYAIYQMTKEEAAKSKKDSKKEEQQQPQPQAEVEQPVRKPHTTSVSSEAEVPEWMSKSNPQVQKTDIKMLQKSWQSSSTTLEDESKSHGSGATSDSSDDEFVPSWKASVNADEDEDFVPSWMSKKEPQTSMEEIPTAGNLKAKHAAVSGLVSSNQVISDIAFAFSDAVFVYPGARKSALGEQVEHKAAVARNAFRHSVTVKVMETRAGAGEAAVGALSNGCNASILATSASLKEMIPAMYEMAAERLPAVIHTAAFSVDADLAIQQDLSEVMTVRDAGFSMIASANLKETHDMAIASHIIALKYSSPVLHFFDGARMDQLSKVEIASAASLEIIAEKHATQSKHNSLAASAGLEAASHKDRPHTAVVVQNVFNQLSQALGHQYEVMEYVGSPMAEAVVIALGSVASVVETVISTTRNVGLIKVRLLKPWSAADLLERLPLSVRRVCVVDQAESMPLFNEVAASFYTETAFERKRPTPLLVGGRVLANAQGFSASMVHAVLNNLMSDRPQPNFTIGTESASLHVDFNAGVDHYYSGIKQLTVFTSAESKLQTEVASQAIAEQFSLLPNVGVQQYVSTDSYAGDAGVVRAEIRLAPSTIRLPESFAVSDAQVVLIEQSVLNATGLAAVASLKEGGTLVVLPSTYINEEDNTVVSKELDLPIDVKVALARKAGHVVLVDPKTLFQAAIEMGHVKNTDLLKTASLWIALAGSIKILKGAEVFGQLVGSLKNALQIARPFSDEAKLLNIVSSGLSRVDGYLVMLGKETTHQLTFGGIGGPSSFGSPFVSHRSYDSSSEYESVHSGTFGGMSPIPPRSFSLALQQFIPRMQLSSKNDKTKNGASLCGTSDEQIVSIGQKAALPRLFPEAYGAKEVLRPSEHGVHLVRLTKNKRLTPGDYERNIFHLEFDISGTALKYQIGDALGVYGHNDEQDVDDFIEKYGLDANALVSIPSRKKMEKGLAEVMSVRNLLVKYLDIFGKPSKKFYIALAGHATSRYEYLKLMHTGTDDNEAFKLGVNEGMNFADLLLHYKTANPTIEQIIEMVPPIAPRHYSIASSMKMNPRSVHLLVVAVDWVTPLGRQRFGQCTRYLSRLDPSKGDIYVSVDVMPSVLRMPPSPKQPIIMSGLGTGMAPFRAFVQERKYQKEMGMDVGPVVLFFGSRHRHQEWLYGEEWEEYHKEGLVTHLGLAFSRDQKEKIYIQDRMNEVSDMLRDHLSEEKKGVILLCGPTWPVPAINAAISKALNPEAAAKGEIDFEQAERLKREGRFTLEVY